MGKQPIFGQVINGNSPVYPGQNQTPSFYSSAGNNSATSLDEKIMAVQDKIYRLEKTNPHFDLSSNMNMSDPRVQQQEAYEKQMLELQRELSNLIAERDAQQRRWQIATQVMKNQMMY